MNLKNIIVLVLLFPLQRFAQNSEKEIMSLKYKNEDSLKITIKYKESLGCLGHFVGKINITTNKGKLGFHHVTSSEVLNSEGFSGTDKNVIDLIIALESISKKNPPVCYGIRGDHCYFLNLTINDSSTEFKYKVNGEDHWNGLNELILKIKAMKN